MSRKVGRIRCNACQRVLEAPDDRRTPRPHEAAQIAAADGLEKGRLMFTFGRPGNQREGGHMVRDSHGVWWVRFFCACGSSFVIGADHLAALRLAARDRREDLYIPRDTLATNGT